VLPVGGPVFERAAAGGLEIRATVVVGLQEQVFAHDDGDEDLLHVNPPASEHPLGTHGA
jgi:hypothetical protein